MADKFDLARKLHNAEGVRDFLAQAAFNAVRDQGQEGVTVSAGACLVNSNQVRVDTPVSTYIVTVEEV